MVPGTNVIKLFSAVVSYDFRNKQVFAHSKPFQPSLFFVAKARSLP